MSLPSPSTSGGASSAMDPAVQAQFDAPLMALANRSGGDLRMLMFAFFSFLHRRTDFYVIPNEDDVKEGRPIKMGFREGDAEKMLLAAFRQFPLRKMPRQGGSDGHDGAGGTSKESKPAKETPAKEPKPAMPSQSSTTSPLKAEKELAPAPSTASKACDNKSSEKDPMEAVRLTEEGKQIPVGNGGSTKRYTWTQTVDEASVILAVPGGTKGKDLAVDLKTSSFSVRTKRTVNGEVEPRTLLRGDLVDKIRTDESTWSLEGGALVVTLDKLQKKWWSAVFVGDDEIDTSLVDSRSRIDEYDDSTQAAIRKIIFDQNQERLGLPTSNDILGETPPLPPMPPGVEYIDKATLDKHSSDKAEGK